MSYARKEWLAKRNKATLISLCSRGRATSANIGQKKNNVQRIWRILNKILAKTHFKCKYKKKKLKKNPHFCENMVSEGEVKSPYFLQVWWVLVTLINLHVYTSAEYTRYQNTLGTSNKNQFSFQNNSE
jgi:hypothetical protein